MCQGIDQSKTLFAFFLLWFEWAASERQVPRALQKKKGDTAEKDLIKQSPSAKHTEIKHVDNVETASLHSLLSTMILSNHLLYFL